MADYPPNIMIRGVAARPETSTTRKGDDMLKMGVGVYAGKIDDEYQTEWYNVVCMGDFPDVNKGDKVIVEGDLKVGYYQEKRQLTLFATSVTVTDKKAPTKPKAEPVEEYDL